MLFLNSFLIQFFCVCASVGDEVTFIKLVESVYVIHRAHFLSALSFICRNTSGLVGLPGVKALSLYSL